MRSGRSSKPFFRLHSMPDLFPAPMQGASVQSVELSVFADQKSRANTNTGHGEMAEEAITLLDNLFGMDAEVTGRDNAKDGADRRVGDTHIQTKYYSSARGSLEACFDEETGFYRYVRDGEPMQMEVPADQYDRAVALFADKIAAGLVPGVTDPAQASDIVRAGRLTYQQAVNLTRPLTAESLAYDAAGGVLISICAMVISFAASAGATFFRTRNAKAALQTGFRTGLQGSGRAFGQHLLIAQLARTELAAATLPAAEAAVDPLSRQAVMTATGAVRALTGKAAASFQASEGQLARMLRTGTLSSIVIFLLLTVPDLFRAVTHRISAAQFGRNIVCRLASLTGGTVGAMAAGMLLSAPVSPILGTLIAMGGAFLGGTLLSYGVNRLIGLFHRDDYSRAVDSLHAAAMQLCTQFMLNDRETAALSIRLRRIPSGELRRFRMRLLRAENKQLLIRDFLLPHFQAVTAGRPVETAARAMTLELPDIR